jgi:hypothetical protein
MRLQRTVMLEVTALIGSAGLAGLQMVSPSAAFASNPYHIIVDGGGATPAAAEADAASQVPYGCTKPWVIDGPYVNDGEWVVVEEATCPPEE